MDALLDWNPEEEVACVLVDMTKPRDTTTRMSSRSQNPSNGSRVLSLCRGLLVYCI